ncbi:DMT family transporter [Noviherbaspirillum sp. CPCC 100848]|uniref:DMT family transporter n=1 Tax=Noviherbaspirillum album TaxID=3080276 RepID=A0ABU6JAW7_9BURK|nr:DMT family transporter [Noviherbaspirillum sp. CPCC 100848]MEC4720802.1 DMT family transporter [Noviherbaspirillum sp. CPCC 100848]
MQTLFILSSLIGGTVLAFQAGANAQLSKAMGNPYSATAVQLAVGAGLLLAATVLTDSLSALGRLSGAPWWHAIGGLASALYVLSTIVLFPRIGAIVTVGLLIAGQMLMSLILDGFGWLGVPRQEPDIGTLLGTVSVLAGVAAIMAGQSGKDAAQGLSGKPGLAAFALLSGALLPVQGAINALLRADLQASFAVGFVSFAVATMAMAAVLTLRLILSAASAPVSASNAGGFRSLPWWGWLGGVAGSVYVTVVFTSIPAIGASAVIALTVAGQQAASIVVDRFGLLRFPKREISRIRLAGVAALLAGVALIKLF